MPTTPEEKLEILRSNHHVIAVFDQALKTGPPLVLLLSKKSNLTTLTLPKHLTLDDVEIRIQRPFTDLRLNLPRAPGTCYNEPIPGGVQIKPRGAGWVGTLGVACQFDTTEGEPRIGILSNWHVLAGGKYEQGTAISQPTDSEPAMARLERFKPVSPSIVNIMDVALADAKMGNFHTVSPEIHGIGALGVEINEPEMGLAVKKSGRTTGVTNAVCMAVDATVKVSYGDFTATFEHQAMFTNPLEPFSAPGDSGSLIVCCQENQPVALLFAGSDLLTVGCPMRPIADAFNITFDF